MNSYAALKFEATNIALNLSDFIYSTNFGMFDYIMNFMEAQSIGVFFPLQK